jgi:hypothetical protein
MSDVFPEDWDDYEHNGLEDQFEHLSSQAGGARSSVDDTILHSSSYENFHRFMAGNPKRPLDRLDAGDGKDVGRTLSNRGAVAIVLYRNSAPNPHANDIWPECRSSAKLPARYHLLDKDRISSADQNFRRGPTRASKSNVSRTREMDDSHETLPDAPIGRPKWELPVELVEYIAGYLNRDDIKSLRMVSRELNQYVSQVIFKTVVVPFNTEIYGMLGHGKKPDLKGKKRAKVDKPEYSWKNTNGDEVYNGHGLDVFRGFGRHILRYGMSFEVNEDSLAQPPTKSVTEQKTSFWGNYDWPFEEYRRFDAVAGLETAADETPRMKIAFSELTRVKELALSVDSGLGWLNGPDKSIRARILQRHPKVFGTRKDIPDRRAQAQQELWAHIEGRHQVAGRDVKLATLYRLDGARPLSEFQEASMLTQEQSEMPYIDPHLIHEAIPHDTVDFQLPLSFDDPEVLDRFVLAPSSSSTGILFTSTTPPTDAGQILSPIIPANLTKAQKEWLLETEWAQRAFVSSYMLSVIDNPNTFVPVHTLNISRLSDRYLPMLSRADFWNALPNLENLTLMVIPGWRTVHKDEAGFVDTPRINPASGVDTFSELLSNHIAGRPGITNLTIGWISGGEHAEGLHARNKLIMPAPLMRLGVRGDSSSGLTSDGLTVLDATRLQAALLHFPSVERLTLQNCWITPPALLQFVKIHDACNLRHLTLNSVSLTAVLRTIANGNQVGIQAGVVNVAAPPIAQPLVGGPLWNVFNNYFGGQAPIQAHAQLIPNHNQVMQWYIQALLAQLQHQQGNGGGVQQQNQIAVLQTQLAQQLQQFQNQNPQQFHAQAQAQVQAPNLQPQPHANANLVAALGAQVQALQHQAAAAANAVPGAIPAPIQATFQPLANPQSLLQSPPREGSWMNVIDVISPGTNLEDFGSEHSQADADRQTALRSIEFISCGYVKLPYVGLDQTGIDFGNGLVAALRNPVFTKRYLALAPAMLSAKWAHLGEIVQEVELSELAALDAGWNLRAGWEDAEEARAVEFDSLLPGGTGRFSGIIRQSDRVVNKADSAS